jgi:transposase
VAKRGGTLLEADPKNITRRDHACGHLDEERPTALLHTCKGCGRRYDQDHNAAQNLLAQVVA